mgnify:CR=1 FL=1
MLSLSRKSKIISLAAISLLLIGLIPSPGIAKETTTDGASEENAFPEEGINTWIPTGDFATSSLVKVPRFPDEILGDADERNLQLASVRNEQVSAQLAVASTQEINNLSTSISEMTNESGAAISSENIDIRYVGYVPVKEKREVVGGALIEDVAGRAVSGKKGQEVVADPLLELSKIDVPNNEVQPIWFTFNIPESAEPGKYNGKITLSSENNETITYDLQLTVHDVELPKPEDYNFNLDVWMNPNAIAEEYNVEPWESEAHWELIEQYFADLADRGQNAITTTVIHHPWAVAWNNWEPQTQVGYDSMVKWKYDGEDWSFDYSIFDRYVEMGLEAGLGPNINAYSMLNFRGDQRITYLDEETGEMVTEVTDVGTPIWTEAWTAFLNDFTDHLKENGWMDQTYIAFDERPASLMSPVMDLIREEAPEFLDQIQVAGSTDVNSYANILSLDFHASTQVSDEWIKERHESGKETSYYVWAGDTHPNTLSFSPAVESRMMPWISADRNLDGFLRWAYNNWPNDIFQNPVYAFTQGDEYFIYPGEKGPMSSIRWELLKEGIEDYELSQIAKEENQDSKVIEEALDLATRHWDGREKNVLDIELAKEMIIGELVTKNAEEMKKIAAQFEEIGAFGNTLAGHTVKLHLMSVNHFESRGEATKVIRHLQGFKQLLDFQSDNGVISEMAYHTLRENADSLIDKWEQ